MQKRKLVILVGLLINSLNALAEGPWVESREAYNTASKQNELALRGGYYFSNGAGVMITNAYDLGEINTLKESYNEVESWYPLFRLNNFTNISPGGIINSSVNGSSISWYLDLKNNISNEINISSRYRYNHKNYETTDNTGQMDYDDTHQLTIFTNLKITDKFTYTFEPDYFKHVNNFYSRNGKNSNWEINNKFSYMISSKWNPYIEVSWLDRWNTYNKDQYRFRTGLRFYF
jgi:hypothetical protein